MDTTLQQLLTYDWHLAVIPLIFGFVGLFILVGTVNVAEGKRAPTKSELWLKGSLWISAFLTSSIFFWFIILNGLFNKKDCAEDAEEECEDSKQFTTAKYLFATVCVLYALFTH